MFGYLLSIWIVSTVSIIKSLAFNQEAKCSCMAPQWQTIQQVTDREYDLRGAQTGEMESAVVVSYDYTNQRIATRNVKDGSRTITFHKENKFYKIRNGLCQVQPTYGRVMDKICMQDGAMFGGHFTLGLDSKIEMWHYRTSNDHMNMTIRTSVTQNSCLPVTEELFLKQGDFAQSRSFLYLNTVEGIEDPSEFDVPGDCYSLEMIRKALAKSILQGKE